MQRRALFPIFVAALVTGSFAAGLFQPELNAQGLPEILSALRPGGGRELDPLATYSRVLQTVKERYYGDLPPDVRLTYSAIRGMLNTLDDPYTRFLDPKEYKELKDENHGEFEGIGAELAGQPTREGYIRINRPLPDGPAARAGVRRGDLIMKVDGKSVVGMTVDEAVHLIRGKAGTVVVLTIQRPGEPKPIEIPIRRAPVEFNIISYRMLEGNVGYISLSQFNEMADPKLERAVRELDQKGMKALILDLRGNPGGLLDAAIDIASRFVPGDKGVVWIVEAGDKDLRRTNPRKYLGGKWPLVVLVNRTSASASEIVAGAIKDNRAGIIVGTTTFGKGLVQTVVPLEDFSACMITTAKYLTPSGKDINRSREQRGGVEPDVVVEVSEEQFFRREDPQLKKALEILHEKIGYRAVARTQAGNR